MGIFGAILDPIGSILGAISPTLGNIWTAFTKWTAAYHIMKFFGDNILAPIIKWMFGLEDKDIYEVNVVAVKMFQEDLYKRTQLDLVTTYMKNEDYDAKNYALGFADSGDKQFGNYYRHGKWYYLDYLPELRISGISIPSKEIKDIIERTKNDKITIQDILVTAPYDDDWCKYNLQEQYDYNVGGNFVKFDDDYYAFHSCKHNGSSFSVILSPLSTVRARVYKVTTVTVNPISSVDIKVYELVDAVKVNELVQVNVTDTIMVKTLYEETKKVIYIKTETRVTPKPPVKPTDPITQDVVVVVKYRVIETYISDSNILIAQEIEQQTSSSTDVTHGSIQDSSTIDMVSEEISYSYIKYTAITRTTIKYFPDSDKALTETTDVVETSAVPTDELVDSTQDTVTSSYQEQSLFLKVTKTKRTDYTDKSDTVFNSEIEEISTQYYTASDDTNEYSTSTLISHISISDEELERTVITEETTYSSIETGVIFSTFTKVLKDETIAVETGTGQASVNTEIIQDDIINRPITDSKTVIVPDHENKRRYSVYYTSTKNERKYLWIYDPSTNIYPNLTTPIEHIDNIESYPITLLRNYYFDIDEYNKDSKDGRNRPNTITKERYDATKNLLNKVGMDVKTVLEAYKGNSDIDKLQDAYFLFAVSPSNDAPIVSKVLFEMFDFIGDKIPYVDDVETACSASYKEQAFNASFIWTPTGTIISKNKIGSIGTYKHTISGQDLILEKQITFTEVKTIRLKECACFTVVNWSIAKGGKDFSLGDENLIIPLIVPVVERLSLMDKTQLLGNSAYMIFYSFQHQHIKWYQTKEFASAMQIITIGIAIIVTIIVTVFTWGTGTAASLSWSAALMAAFKAVAIGVGLSLALQFIANNVNDTKLKMLLSVAAAAVAIYAGGGFAAGQSIGTTAAQLVQLCATAINVYAQDMQQRLQKEMNKLQQDVMNFQTKYEKRSKELTDRYTQMTSGLTVENMVGLIDMTSFETSRNASTDILMLSPSQFYHMAIGAYRDYDTLYSGMYDQMVHKFCKNKLNMGVTPDE